MSDKFSLRDFYIYIIPGSIYIIFIGLVFNIFDIEIMYPVESVMSITLTNGVVEMIDEVTGGTIEKVISTMTYSVPSVLVGYIFIVLAFFVGQAASGIVIFFRTGNRNEQIRISKDDNISQRFEVYDDLLKTKDIENTWVRYRDLEMSLKHNRIPLLCSFVGVIVVMCKDSILCEIVLGLIVIVIILIIGLLYRLHVVRVKRYNEIIRMMLLNEEKISDSFKKETEIIEIFNNEETYNVKLKALKAYFYKEVLKPVEDSKTTVKAEQESASNNLDNNTDN